MKPLIKQTIVITGPTASGKSDLAILLAHRYDGEIISADSRQVYRGMDIGTGKVTRDVVVHPEPTEGSYNSVTNHPKSRSKFQKEDFFFSEGIRHHLIDIASPKRAYNVTHFVRDAKRAIADIRKRGKTPIICGGTGFWVQALIDNQSFPAVKPDATLRKKLGKLSTEQLFALLQKKDPRRAKTIDAKNKVRLIRALEVIATLGKVPIQTTGYKLQATSHSIIALNPDKTVLEKNIKVRLKKRLQQGMLEEVARLHEKDGVSWKRLESFGLEYRSSAQFLQQKISREAMEEGLLRDIKHYAKRQITWLKRFEKMGADIHWITDAREAIKIVEKNTHNL